MTKPASPFRLVLWPTVVTLAISLARLLGQVQGWIPPTSGGALHPLGITWCIFVFGGWFGFRLARSGSSPTLARPWALALLALAAAAGVGFWQFRALAEAGSETDFAALRGAVAMIAAVTGAGALLMFAVWPRLAFTLLLYALPARLTIVAITWLAKRCEWNTHYTKFGRAGLERDMPETMLAASVAQLGFWVPFTILGGMLVGGIFGRRRE